LIDHPTHNLNKEKSKPQGQQAPIDFVVPLQLEECVYRIEHTSPSASLKLATRFSVYPIWHRNYTSANQFEAVFFTNGIMSARMQGYLHRWEGTSTRLMGDIEYSQADNLKLLLRFVFILYCDIFIIAVCGVTLACVFRSLFSTEALDKLGIALGSGAAIIAIARLYVKSGHPRSEQLADQIKNALMNPVR
jgi:hypothetical protein